MNIYFNIREKQQQKEAFLVVPLFSICLDIDSEPNFTFYFYNIGLKGHCREKSLRVQPPTFAI
jgi:hypothetical protein